jgi:hypothetical protein
MGFFKWKIVALGDEAMKKKRKNDIFEIFFHQF